MASLDSPCIPGKQVIAIAPQASALVAPSTAIAMRIVCDEGTEIRRGSQRLHPTGTTGYSWDVDSEFEAAKQPGALLIVQAGSAQLLPLLESLFAGQPTVGAGQWTETGDGGGLLSLWAFTGLRPGFNCELTSAGWKLYVELDADQPNATTTRVRVYADAAKSILVCQGDIVDGSVPGVVTLAAQGDYGLSGVVTLASVPGGDDTDIVVAVNEVTLAWADQPARYWALWRENGVRMEQLLGCWVHRLKLTAQELGSLRLEVELVAMTYTLEASAFSSVAALPGGVNFLCYPDGVVRSDVAGTPVTEYPEQVELEVVREHDVVFGSSLLPVAFIAGDAKFTGQLLMRAAAGQKAIADRSIAGNWDSLDFTFTRSTQRLAISLDKVKFIEPKEPLFGRPKLPSVPMPFVAVQDTSDPATKPIAITLRPHVA